MIALLFFRADRLPAESYLVGLEDVVAPHEGKGVRGFRDDNPVGLWKSLGVIR